MIKKRLTALDGLRGLAAISVFFSHTGFDPKFIINIPFITELFKILAVGPNSVQILFVLSGFLMAYLYPTVTNKINFIQKRYARIFPVFTVVVFYIWLNNLLINYHNTIWELVILIGLAVTFFLTWQIISRIDKNNYFVKSLFFIFIFLQLSTILINLTIIPKLIDSHLILDNFFGKTFLMWETLSLTTPFVRGITQSSGVFWSLIPEVAFYVLYPFFVTPLIKIGKRYGWLISLIIIASLTKMFLDMDKVMAGLFAFHTINIARVNGFVVGVVIGSIFQSQGKIWKILKPIFSNIFINVLVLAGLIFIQWGDSAIRDGQAIWFMNLYYLMSSWIIGSVIISAVIPDTLVNKIFSNRILVFLGIISFSLYLIHTNMISLSQKIILPLLTGMDSIKIITIVGLLLTLVLTLIVSYLLYFFIERLYFQNKGKINDKRLPISKSVKPVTKWGLVIGTICTIGMIIFVYSGAFAPSLFVSHHLINIKSKSKEVSLVKNKVRFAILSKYDNLSAIFINLRYAKNAEFTRHHQKNPAILYMRLYKDNETKPFFQSQRHAYEIEGDPQFPFGFPTVINSKVKKYIIELELKNGTTKDQVFVDTSSNSVVTVYTNNKKEILLHPQKLIWNRLLFTLSNMDGLFAIIFIILVSCLLALS